MSVDDLDICECGDYRRQHAEGEWACEAGCAGMNGRPCRMFRPHLRADISWRADR